MLWTAGEVGNDDILALHTYYIAVYSSGVLRAT